MTNLEGLLNYVVAGALTIESVLRRYEWALLKACGHSFLWAVEARTRLIVTGDNFYQFIPGEGFVFSSTGIPGEHLLAISEDNLSEIYCLKSAKIIMRQAIDHLLGGREIKARALYSARHPERSVRHPERSEGSPNRGSARPTGDPSLRSG